VEQYILSIEKDFDVAIQGAGFDRYNAMSTMQRLESADDPVECTEVRQHSSVLHPATKLLYEYVCKGHFRYECNMLLENSFSNARCTEDTNLNKYVNKKRSKGKVDMVVALINAVYMLMQFELLDGDDFFVG
jgi:phage terminase large subunit-like protein